MPYIGNTSPSRFVSNRAASVYSGDGSTTAFTLEQAVVQDEDILVSVDGVVQEPSVAYAVSNGTTLTFTAAPSSNSGNNIFVYYLASQVGTVGHPSNQALSATNGTFSAGLDVVNASDSTQMVVRGRSSDNFGIITFKNNAGDTTKGQVKSDASSNLILRAGPTNDALKIDTNGHVTKPLQPAFLVKPASEQSNIAVSSVVTIAFGTEIFDNNGDFASNTFTAPVTGRYQFNLQIRLNNLDSASDYYRIEFTTSNRTYHQLIDPDFGQDAAFWTATMSVLIDMDASDACVVKITQGGGTQQTDIDANNGYTTFSGYLVA